MSIIEEKDYVVTLTIRLTTKIWFGPMKRDGFITKADAIDNAIGCLPQDLFDGFGGEFMVALPIDGEAEEVK